MPGTLAACLSSADVARHQRRRGEAEDLPEGEVPGHDREHRPERVVAHAGCALASVADRLGRRGSARRARRRSRRPRRTSRPRPRPRRSACPSPRSSAGRSRRGAVAQEVGGRAHQAGRARRTAPCARRRRPARRAARRSATSRLVVLGVVADQLSGGGIDGFHHAVPDGEERMAEREGFEPSVRVYPGQLLSRQPCSATPAPLLRVRQGPSL